MERLAVRRDVGVRNRLEKWKRRGSVGDEGFVAELVSVVVGSPAAVTESDTDSGWGTGALSNSRAEKVPSPGLDECIVGTASRSAP